MALVIVRHKVKDFATWKNAFDAHAAASTGNFFDRSREYQGKIRDLEGLIPAF